MTSIRKEETEKTRRKIRAITCWREWAEKLFIEIYSLYSGLKIVCIPRRFAYCRITAISKRSGTNYFACFLSHAWLAPDVSYRCHGYIVHSGATVDNYLWDTMHKRKQDEGALRHVVMTNVFS